MAVFLGTVSRQSPGYWKLARDAGVWGVTSARAAAARRVEAGDSVIIWLGGRGYRALCTATAPCWSPKGPSEAPWEGGVYQWQHVVPFTVTAELGRPAMAPLQRRCPRADRPVESAVPSSFQSVPDEKGAAISSLSRQAKMREQRSEGSGRKGAEKIQSISR